MTAIPARQVWLEYSSKGFAPGALSKIGYNTGSFNAAAISDQGCRLAHSWIAPLHSSQLERKIRLHGGIDFRRTAPVNAPSAIRELLRQQMLNALMLQITIDLSRPVHESDVVGAQS